MSHWTIAKAIVFDIDWHYTITWFPPSPYKTHRYLSTCIIRVRFVYERRRYATMVKMRHGFATLNSNNFIVYSQEHKVWVLLFLVRTSGNILRPKFSRFGEILCFATKLHCLLPTTLKKRCYVFHQKGSVVKQLFHAVCSIVKLLLLLESKVAKSCLIFTIVA